MSPSSPFFRAQAASKEDLKGMVPDKKGAAPAKKAAASTKAAGSPRGPKPGAKAAKAAKASTSGKAASGATDGGDDSDKPDTPASTGGSQRAFKGSTQQWTLQEDNLLRKLVDEHGHRKWSFIAGKMEGRRGKQCRDRWLNHLKPDIRRGEWTAEEERILVEGHRMLGTRWAALAKLLPGRPENAIKNHWHATLRCKWAQRGGRISELQAYQHSLNLTNGGGASATAAQKVAAAAATPSPFPTAAASAAAVAAAAAAAVTKSKGTPGSAFEFDGAAAAAAVAAAAAAVVGRGGGGQTPEGDTQAIARALDNIVTGGAAASPTVAAGTAAIAAANANATVSDGAAKQDGDEAALAAMLGGMADGGARAAALAQISSAGGAPAASPTAVDVRPSAAMNPVALAGPEGTDGDVIEATSHPLDLNRVMASVRASRGAELASLTSCADSSSQSGFPALGESLAQHGALVEAALRRITNTIRKKWNVIRVALVVRLGTIENGALSLIVAVSASRWRDALDAAQHASLEIKDKLTASIAPLCLGKEPKAAAALAAVAAAAGTTTANILGQTIGDLAVEAIVEAVTRGDRDKVLTTAAQREEEQATAAAKRDEKGADAAATKEEAPEASVEPEGAATPDEGKTEKV